MKRTALLSFAAAVLCCGMAFAQPNAQPAPEPFFDEGPGFEQFDHPGMQQMLGEKLGLSAEQKDQIQKIMLETRKKSIEVEAKGKIARIELHELMISDNVDQKKLDAKIAELSQVHETMLRSHIETMLAVKKILTPEQRAKLKEMRPMGFGEGMRGRMGMGMGMPGHGPGMMGPHHMGPRPGPGGQPRGERD